MNYTEGFYALLPREFIKGLIPGGGRLSMGARNLLAYLISWRGVDYIYVSQITMGRELGVTRTMISKYLNELSDAGFIIKTSRGKGVTCMLELDAYVVDCIEDLKDSYASP